MIRRKVTPFRGSTQPLAPLGLRLNVSQINNRKLKVVSNWNGLESTSQDFNGTEQTHFNFWLLTFPSRRPSWETSSSTPLNHGLGDHGWVWCTWTALAREKGTITPRYTFMSYIIFSYYIIVGTYPILVCLFPRAVFCYKRYTWFLSVFITLNGVSTACNNLLSSSYTSYALDFTTDRVPNVNHPRNRHDTIPFPTFIEKRI